MSHVELVGLGGGRLLVVVVTDTGRVSQRLAVVPDELDDTAVIRLRSLFGDLVVRRSVRDGAQRIGALLADDSATAQDAAARAIARVLAEELDEFRQDRLLLAGAANLARRESDFRGSIYPLLEAIEEQVTLLRLMGEMVADEQGLAASIGRENESFGLSEASVVTSDYDATGGTALVGVLGPTRMDYPGTMAAVRAVARYVSRLLDEA